MGSPLSPILADLVMDILLRTVTKKLGFPLPVLKKYVDDLILALPRDQIEHVLQIFNSYNQHLQFTVEKEDDDGRLPFLDILLIRNNDQTISTRWYSKPISSGRLLNFHSFHPITMKMNVATNLINRVIALTTDHSGQQQSSIIFQQLRQNNYPSTLINRLINRAITSRNNSQNQLQDHPTTFTPSNHTQLQIDHHSISSINHVEATANTDEIQTSTAQPQPASEQPPDSRSTYPDHRNNHLQPTVARTHYRSIPYIAELSPTISSLLKNDFPQVKIAYKTLKNTKSLLRPVKDHVDLLDQCNVVYSLSCDNCQQTYIGMTRNHLKTRISGHKSNINEYTKLIQSNNTNIEEQIANFQAKTALMKHIIDKNHTFNLTQPKILDRTNRSSALPLLEMCHIAYATNTVNHRTDVQGLSTTYAGLFHTIKKSTVRKRSTNTDRTNVLPTTPTDDLFDETNERTPALSMILNTP